MSGILLTGKLGQEANLPKSLTQIKLFQIPNSPFHGPFHSFSEELEGKGESFTRDLGETLTTVECRAYSTTLTTANTSILDVHCTPSII